MEITELKAKRDSALATTEKRLTTYKKMVLGEVPWQLRRLRIQCYHCCDEFDPWLGNYHMPWAWTKMK